MANILDERKLLEEVERSMNFMLRYDYPQLMLIEPLDATAPVSTDVYQPPTNKLLRYRQYTQLRVDRETGSDTFLVPKLTRMSEQREAVKTWLLCTAYDELSRRLEPFVKPDPVAGDEFVATLARVFVRRVAWQVQATWWLDIYQKETRVEHTAES